MNLTTSTLKQIIKEEFYSLITESNPVLSNAPDAIRSLGFANVEYVASGQYGHVFKAIWQAQDNLPRAIKVMYNDANGQREANIYKKVSDARAKSDEVAKHFAAVDMITVSQDKLYIMIVMELLENDPNVKPVIEDLFGFREVGAFRPDVSLEDLDVFKDIGYRANMMVVEPQSRLILIDHMAYSFPKEVQQELRKIVFGMNFDNIIYPETKINKLKSLMLQKNPALWDYVSVAEEDLKNSGTAAMSFLFYFIAYSIRKLISAPHNISLDDIMDELEFSVEHFIESYRNYTPIGIGGPNYPGAPKEAGALGYPGAKSLLKAIRDLKTHTGLEARDMHDRNVLVRPVTKDIVIVDVGLFKNVGNRTVAEDKKWSKSERSKRKKSCANPKGFTMKQFCKNQKTRSKKGQRKNEEIEEAYSEPQQRFMCAMSKQGADRPKGLTKKAATKQCKSPIKKENLDERCQKGYKTHPTRKTKKMFGRTYRNCVKAEEGKDPKKGTGKKPKGSGRRLYTDEDPSDTVKVSFKSMSAIRKTLAKKSFKSKSHKRQSQIINLIHQRARAAYRNAKDPKTKARLKKAYEYAKKRKEASKRKTIRLRKKKKKK
tara:strand:+ start:6281 stop:8080 length:1800 start_codon:yes stop_codon:yes gene_type:complete